jgi:HNH endonuclease
MTIEFTLKGYTCKVDECDGDLVGLRWYIRPGVNTQYAIRHIPKNHRKSEQMHRVIIERVLGRAVSPHELVDHKDGDGLNNTRKNLRLATPSQNMANGKVRKNNKLGVKGVVRIGRKFQATISISNKKKYLGTFDTAQKAHAAYVEAAIKYHGEFARGE